METSSTLSSLVLNSPSAAYVFEKYDLDYCCKGHQSLDEACRTVNADPKAVLKEVQDSFNAEVPTSFHPWMWDTPLLISYIVQNHHKYLRDTLPVVQRLFRRVAVKHGERFPEVYALSELFDEVANELFEHLSNEEALLYTPAMKSLTYDDLQKIISEHDEDHQSVGLKLLRLRAISNTYSPPDGSCISHRTAYRMLREVVQDTMQHVFLENSVLFPKLLRENLSQTPNHGLQVQGGRNESN